MIRAHTGTRVRVERAVNAMAVAITTLVASACASTGATFRSGVGDAFPEHPPYYAGASAAAMAADTSRIGYLPVTFQAGASQNPIFDPRFGPDTPIGALLAEMNGYLDSLLQVRGIGPRLADGGRVSAVAHADTRMPPNVIFGCITEDNTPDGECAARGDSVLGRRGQRMRLAVGRPSNEWVEWISELQRGTRTQRTLVVTLEIGQYLPRQRGIAGTKEVELGTNHVARLPWLTSLETPVSVVQLTGSIVGPDGLPRRIGAEGVHAHASRLLVSAAGAQEVIGARDFDEMRSARRDELPGAPLAWRVALATLVSQLTGTSAR